MEHNGKTRLQQQQQKKKPNPNLIKVHRKSSLKKWRRGSQQTSSGTDGASTWFPMLPDGSSWFPIIPHGSATLFLYVHTFINIFFRGRNSITNKWKPPKYQPRDQATLTWDLSERDRRAQARAHNQTVSGSVQSVTHVLRGGTGCSVSRDLPPSLLVKVCSTDLPCSFTGLS